MQLHRKFTRAKAVPAIACQKLRSHHWSMRDSPTQLTAATPSCRSVTIPCATEHIDARRRQASRGLQGVYLFEIQTSYYCSMRWLSYMPQSSAQPGNAGKADSKPHKSFQLHTLNHQTTYKIMFQHTTVTTHHCLQAVLCMCSSGHTARKYFCHPVCDREPSSYHEQDRLTRPT